MTLKLIATAPSPSKGCELWAAAEELCARAGRGYVGVRVVDIRSCGRDGGSVERVAVAPGLHVVLNDLWPRRGVAPVDGHFGDSVAGQGAVMQEGERLR